MANREEAKWPEYTDCVEDVIRAESEYIKQERDPSFGDNLWGLAISGGGIRSASFGLGVMQALVANSPRSILKRIDYLSTVSGGGYIGSALTWFLHKGLPGDGAAGTEPGDFPLGQIGSGARTDPKGNLVLDFVRQHGNYLTPGKGLNAMSLFGVALRSMFVSLVVYLSILTIMMVGLRMSRIFGTLSINEILEGSFTKCPALLNLIWLAIAIVVLLALGSLVFSVATYSARGGARHYERLVAGQRRIGLAWTAVFGLVLVGSVPYVSSWLSILWQQVTAGSSTAIGIVMGFLEYRRAQKPGTSDEGGVFSTFRIIIAASTLCYGLLLAAFALSATFSDPWCLVGLVVFAGALGLFVNLNYVGLHRTYRDRLMETFMPNAQNVKDNQWGPATEADATLLEHVCSKARRPYHLVNANVVLIDSPTAKFRGRGGDSFLLSPLYCGSDGTGYRRTKKYMKKGSRGMTLATAMAISGAAINPHTGAAGGGVTRNRLVSALLGLLNLRLGYWAPNPRFRKRLPFPPNFFIPGLTGDVLGSGLTEGKRTIALTDGGHFENLGLYELIRRKASVIIVCDAGADPSFLFGDLANAVERVRVDFGAVIRFDPKYDLGGVLPASGVQGSLTEKYQLAKRGFAIADIRYHGGTSTGTLIYLKTALTAGLPADVYGYRSADARFPDQTTADQFFDEQQFEAYRELGYQLTWQMLRSGKGKQILRY